MKFLLIKEIGEKNFCEELCTLFDIAKKSKVNLIIFPEFFIDALNKKTECYIRELTKKTGISILYLKKDKKVSAFFISPQGECSFDKISHYGSDNRKLISGKKIKIIKWAGKTFSVLICYDSFFPEYIALLKKFQLNFLIVPAFVPKKREDFWRSLIMIRASELQVPVIAVAKAGKRKKEVTFVAYPDFKMDKPLKSTKNYSIFKLKSFKKIRKSPNIRGKILFKKKLFGPFPEDSKKVSVKEINLNRKQTSKIYENLPKS